MRLPSTGSQDIPDFNKFRKWMETLTPSEQKALMARLQKAPSVGPHPGPQTMAFNSTADIVGFGGASGGGKSALIALLILLKHKRSVVFRHDTSQMTHLVDDIASFHGTDAGLNRQSNTFRFTDFPGHMVEFGGIGKPKEEEKWQGRAHDLVAFDECTQLSESKVRWLLTWCRSPDPEFQAKCIMTFNPPGSPSEEGEEDGRWLLKFFAPWIDENYEGTRADPGEIRYFLRDYENEEHEVESGEPRLFEIKGRPVLTYPQSRTFIPSLATDNPSYGQEYINQLMSLEEPNRTRYLMGDFSSSISDHENQIVPTKSVERAMDLWTKEGAKRPMSSIGVDVARGGADFTSLAARHDWWWDKIERVPGKDTPDGHAVASLIYRKVRDGAVVCIDVVGPGSSPYDIVKHTLECIPISGQQRKNLPPVQDQMGFYNLRTALYWLLRKILDPSSGLDARLPQDKKLLRQLCAPRFSRETGLVQMENKVELKKRVGFTIDDADAVAYSLLNWEDTLGSEKLKSVKRPKVNMRQLYGEDRTMGLASASVQGRNSWMGI